MTARRDWERMVDGGGGWVGDIKEKKKESFSGGEVSCIYLCTCTCRSCHNAT